MFSDSLAIIVPIIIIIIIIIITIGFTHSVQGARRRGEGAPRHVTATHTFPHDTAEAAHGKEIRELERQYRVPAHRWGNQDIRKGRVL